MATSNRVFVSPGVYTSEKDLTFVAQSVGITTLGLVGETLMGPAFEPVLINNYDEFRTFFGGSSPEKDGEGNPKYELPYVAKSYLQESNQLFVTRILGLTGYKPLNSWGITTVGDTPVDGITICVLRSRGSYSTATGATLGTLVLKVTNPANVSITANSFAADPYGDFTLQVVTDDADTLTFEVNMDPSSTKYISKVLGTSVYDKSADEFPVYVHEAYPYYIYNHTSGITTETGYTISGLNSALAVIDQEDNYRREWDTAASPWVVSEVRGNWVHDLFKVVTICDGNASNTHVKVMINNIDLEKAEFDIIVRDFNDTDDNMIGLEKFTRCSMNPNLPGFIGKKIGTADGEYELKSKFIMITLADNYPQDAVPAGFKGYVTDNIDGSLIGGVRYKTEYFNAGDNPLTPNGDKVRKVCLGLSTQDGFKYDASLFQFKGVNATGATRGFHLSVNATGVSGNTVYETTPYVLENQTGDTTNKLEDIRYRKFTFGVYGGFDGWDIYRQTRTYSDNYILGKYYYTTGTTDSALGVFTPLTGGTPNSDYYAYLQGIQTYQSPEAIDINVFATPGINFYDHSSLTLQAIDIIENDRSDSLYLLNAKNRATVEEVIDDLEEIGLDSNYSATYWPWIQVRDEDNAVQLYIPPTGEVLRNIALTDNVNYPWFAVAGYSRGIVKSVRALKKLTLEERDDLYKSRINPIATFSDTGTIIWGNKTLQVRESPLDRINVRRLLLRARKLISAVAVRLLFEQNDEQVRNEFLRLVNPILEAIKKERGLNEFRVTVSNDPEDIDNNTMRGKIYIKPTKSLEFIDLEFIITPSGASFENV